MKEITVENYRKDKFYNSIVKIKKELLLIKNEISPLNFFKDEIKFLFLTFVIF